MEGIVAVLKIAIHPQTGIDRGEDIAEDFVGMLHDILERERRQGEAIIQLDKFPQGEAC